YYRVIFISMMYVLVVTLVVMIFFTAERLKGGKIGSRAGVAVGLVTLGIGVSQAVFSKEFDYWSTFPWFFLLYGCLGAAALLQKESGRIGAWRWAAAAVAVVAFVVLSYDNWGGSHRTYDAFGWT